MAVLRGHHAVALPIASHLGGGFTYTKKTSRKRRARLAARLVLFVMVACVIAYGLFVTSILRGAPGHSAKQTDAVQDEGVAAEGQDAVYDEGLGSDGGQMFDNEPVLHAGPGDHLMIQQDSATPHGHRQGGEQEHDVTDKAETEAVTATVAQQHGVGPTQEQLHDMTAQERVQVPGKGLYDLAATDIHGQQRPLSEFAGNVTLVVNVASACGYTDSNYKGLQAVYSKYHRHGFQILAFPCNAFGGQEPGREADILGFCTSKYHVTFPMFSKVEVNGPQAHPVFQYLKKHAPMADGGGGGGGPGNDIQWNFHKFLVDGGGQPVKWWDSRWDGAAVEREVYELLRAQRLHVAAGAG